MKFKYIVSVFSILIVFACTDEVKHEEIPFQEELSALKAEFAPDKRVALLQIEAVKKGDTYILKGESNLPDAVQDFKTKLKQQQITFIDSIQIIPGADLNQKTNGVINISVANLRSKPKHSSELATQATLGTPVKILKKEGEWYYIQTPDKYLSWVDEGGITVMTDKRFMAWKTSDKVVYNNTYGFSYEDETEKETISDLVAGDVLEVVKRTDAHFVAAYPDGRIALVKHTEAKGFSKWITSMNVTPDDLVATSKTLMGVPYLWGGTSTKGVDCSGFTKTIYFLNGMVIPRDASQQVHTGKQIDETQNFENLKKGDLLFFGRKATDTTKEKVVHVGMWIGNHEFIHASNLVRVSSIDPKAANYDEYNLNRYLRTKRIFKEEDKAIINLKQMAVFE